MQYSGIWSLADNKESRDVCDWGFFFSVGLVTWIKDFQVMGHSGKGMTSTKVVMAGLKCSPLGRFQDRGHCLVVHWEHPQDCWQTMQSIGQHLAATLNHLKLIPAHIWDHRTASIGNDSSDQRIQRTQMLQGFWIWKHCRRFGAMNIEAAHESRIHCTLAVKKETPQSAQSKLNSPSSILLKSWGRKTTPHSSSGTKYDGLSIWRNSISHESGSRTISNTFIIKPCRVKQLLHDVFQHSRTACHWTISIIRDRFNVR